MKLIIALGNPGIEYENTRHNLGFMVLDYFLKEENLSLDKEKFGGLYRKLNLISDVEKLTSIVGKPMNYMNNSGSFVFFILNYFKISPEDLLVIYDDKDIKVGNFKISLSSSAGGHNGVKDIEKKLGTKNFVKLRLGIGSQKNITNMRKHVLQKFKNEELIDLKNNFKLYSEIIKNFMINDFLYISNKYNGNK